MKFLCLQASSVWERYGGIESYLDDLLCLLTEAYGPGSCHSVTLSSGPLSPRAPYPVTGVQKWLPGILRKVENRYSLLLLKKALEVARADRPEFILCGHVSLGPLCQVLSQTLKVPVIALVYGIEAWGNLLPQDEWALKAARKIISISEWTKSRLVARGYGANQIFILPPTVPEAAEQWPRRKPTEATSPLRLLTVSRLDSSERYKGHDHVLQALARARAQRPTLAVRYTIHGEGDDKAYLENIVRREKLQDIVDFQPKVANRDDLGSIYSQADVLIMPSRYGFWGGKWRGEGFGIAYTEAALCEVPSIAYDCGGATDIILNEKTGWLVHPDHVPGLTALILELETKREKIAAYGAEARQIVLHRFSRDSVKRLLTTIVAEL